MRRLLFLVVIAISASPTTAWAARFQSSNPDRSFGIGAAIADLFVVAVCVITVRQALRTGYAFTGWSWIDRRQSPKAFRTTLIATVVGAVVVFCGLAYASIASLLHH